MSQFLLRYIFLPIALLSSGVPARAVVVLQYHHIATDTPASTSVSPDRFRQHMDYLQQEGFSVIPIERLVKSLKNGKPLPDKSVVITFDDGYLSIYENALPVLKEKSFPFTVFINTRPVKQKLKSFMSAEQIKSLLQYQATIGNHSVDHLHMIRRLDGESEQDWLVRMRAQVVDAESDILAYTGEKTRLFAYPYGEYNPALEALLGELGYVGFGQQSGAINPEGSLTRLPRFPFGGSYGDIQDFALKVDSRALPVQAITLRDKSNAELASHILKPAQARPVLEILLKPGFEKLDINCYLSGQGRLKREKLDKAWRFSAEKDLSPGRSRYNCTAATGEKGRFYWYSQPWILPLKDGGWYRE